jgi:L-lysine 2,3-aminomutase
LEKHTIDDVLFDGGDGMNIITKELKSKLRLLKPKPTP